MSTYQLARLLVAGFVATVLLTVMFYPAFIFGVPMLDFATTLGAWLGHETAAPLSDIWWQGVGEHFFNGVIVFPLLYAFAGYRHLPARRPWVKGVAWGLALFLIGQYFFVPLHGLGLFSIDAPDPEIFLLANLLACLSYGLVFGALAGSFARNKVERAATVLQHPRREILHDQRIAA